MRLRFGTDGVRGIANTELTPEMALLVGRAAARCLSGTSFVVGRDPRRSGPMLQAAFSAGLASEGMDVVDLGIVPTPGLAFISATTRRPGAMISASHNPFADNGIKLFSEAGTKLADAVERAVEDELDSMISALSTTGAAGHLEPSSRLAGEKVGWIGKDRLDIARYEDHLVGSVSPSADQIRLANLAVVCDCANGAASYIAPSVLSRLGLAVDVINASPNGTNINADCGSTHLDSLAKRVVETGADLGIGFDGDADRVLAIDASGNTIDGDELLAMFAIDLDERDALANRAVVVTVMSNLGLHRALREHNIKVISTPVGDRHVVDAMEANELTLGGEQSGHVVFRAEATTGDGILTAVKLIELMARKSAPLVDLARQAMTRLPQVMRSIKVSASPDLEGSALIASVLERSRARLAGTGRILLRASGTEPLVRVMVESESDAMANEIADSLAEVVKAELGNERH